MFSKRYDSNKKHDPKNQVMIKWTVVVGDLTPRFQEQKSWSLLRRKHNVARRTCAQGNIHKTLTEFSKSKK